MNQKFMKMVKATAVILTLIGTLQALAAPAEISIYFSDSGITGNLPIVGDIYTLQDGNYKIRRPRVIDGYGKYAYVAYFVSRASPQLCKILFGENSTVVEVTKAHITEIVKDLDSVITFDHRGFRSEPTLGGIGLIESLTCSK